MKSKEFVKYVLDDNSFIELRLNINKEKITNYKDAINIGTAFIGGVKCIVCISNSSIYGGTIGEVEGEKIAQAIEIAQKRKLPIICFLNTGGARVQEGVFSLLQMSKIVSVIQKNKILLISVICEYVYGGVYASLLGLSDIVIMEENSRLGFAGKKVIESTYGKKCSTSFQGSEFAIRNGLVDIIVNSNNVRETIYKLLKLHEV